MPILSTMAGCTPRWTTRTSGTTCREATTMAPALLTLQTATAKCINGNRLKPPRASFTNGSRSKIRAVWIFNGCLIIRQYRCLSAPPAHHRNAENIRTQPTLTASLAGTGMWSNTAPEPLTPIGAVSPHSQLTVSAARLSSLATSSHENICHHLSQSIDGLEPPRRIATEREKTEPVKN